MSSVSATIYLNTYFFYFIVYLDNKYFMGNIVTNDNQFLYKLRVRMQQFLL